MYRTSQIVMVLILLSVGLLGCHHQNQIKNDMARLKAYRALQRDEQDQAKELFKACLETDATDMKSHYYLGKIYLNEKQFATARRHLELAYTLRFAKDRPHITIEEDDDPYAVPVPTIETIADSVAESLYQLGYKSQLIGFCREVITEFQTPRSHIRLAKYLQKIGDPDGAKVAIEKAKEIAGKGDMSPYIAAADFYEALGDREAAVRQLQIVYLHSPDNQDVVQRIRQLGYIPGPTLKVGVPQE